MKIFIISPVTIATKKDREMLLEYANDLEIKGGHQVHLPLRDTDQSHSLMGINHQNFDAIRNADEVHVFYRKKSKGIHFDLGMAFALHKTIIFRQTDGEYDNNKSFTVFLSQWQNWYK